MKFVYLLVLLPTLLTASPLSVDNLDYPEIDPTELCPLITLINEKLCQNSSAFGFNPTDLCPVLDLYTDKYCQSHKSISFDPTELCPLITLVDQNSVNLIIQKLGFNPTDLYPLFQLFTDKYCQSHKNIRFSPADLCPLIEIVDQKLCQSNSTNSWF